MRIMMWIAPLLSLAMTAPGEQLAKVYAGQLDYEEPAVGRSWTCLPEDVWELDSFSYTFKGKLEIELGPSVVVFGKHVDERGAKSVVWATIFPKEGSAEQGLVSSEAGHGDHVQSLFMRFHPSLIGELFPRKTVEGQGDPMFLLWAKRVYAAKINGSWQSGNMPVVPFTYSLVFDAETVEGKRRCYIVDTRDKKLNYVSAFAGRTISDPPDKPLSSKQALELFDEAWEAFDREYAMFVVKPNVDWKALRKLYQPLAKQARTNYEVAGVIALLLAHLEDLHIYVKVDGDWVPGYNRWRFLNADWKATKGRLSELKETDRGIAWGEAPANVGYINIWNLSTDGLSDAFDEALEGLGHTRALILDLRYNGGGDEILGRRIAGRFADKEITYSLSQYRTGKKHNKLGPKHPRKLEPRGPWRYQAPVVVLQGQKTMSSAESMALMLAGCPDVTTMGDRTAGSSANPRKLELGEGIVVNLPRWLDLDPEGKPIDAVGIAPMESVDVPSKADGDAVFEAALEFLDGKGKRPGKR